MSEPNMMCLCSMHVHPGAFIIGVIGLVLNLLLAGYCTFIHSYVILLVSLLAFIAYLCLMIGNHNENPILYWPFFAIMPIVLLVELVAALLSFTVFVGSMGLLPDFLAQTQVAQQIVGLYPVLFHPIGMFAAVFGLVLLLLTIMQAYFFFVILKAYGFLKFALANQTFDSAEWKPRIYV